MKIVLLSGGSGTRLWPLSNDSRSKQFLKVIEDGNGCFESMVQRVRRQISTTNGDNEIYIATSNSQVDIIKSQLGEDIHLVVEPEKRDTFPAIALVSSYLYSIIGTSLDEVVCILPVDPYVDDDFFKTVVKLEDAIHDSGADVALLGVKPTYPSEKYGYIVPESKPVENTRPYFNVSHFTEKPSEDKAKSLIIDNAYWNCGIFAFRLKTIINKLIELQLPFRYDELLPRFFCMKKTSFDYEVLEKSKNIIFIPYEGTWKDLGTWNTLTEEMDSNIIGKGYLSDECQNSHLINELNIPIAVLGLSNIVVAASPDGILVSDKKASPKVKEVVKKFDQRPMYEERKWGNNTILDISTEREITIITSKLRIFSNQLLEICQPVLNKKVLTVLVGEGEFRLGNSRKHVKQGEIMEIAAGSRFNIYAQSDMVIIDVEYCVMTESNEANIPLYT